MSKTIYLHKASQLSFKANDKLFIKKSAQRIYELKATKSSIKSDQTINTNTRLAKYDQGVATPFFYQSETRPDKITIILDFPMIENHTIKLIQQSLIAKW